MNYETKRDVFEVAMNHAAKSRWVDYSEMMNRYDAALPDDLPTIPEVVSEEEEAILTRAKEENSYALSILHHYAEEHGGYLLGNKSFEDRLMNAYVNGYTVEKEKKYLVELDGLVTTDGAKQYLTNKDGKWFACRRMSRLNQYFTDKELNAAPEWAQQLNREEVTDDAEES